MVRNRLVEAIKFLFTGNLTYFWTFCVAFVRSCWLPVKTIFFRTGAFLQTNGGMSRCLHFCPCFWCAGTKIPLLVSTLFLKWLFKALPGEWTGNKLLAEPSYFARRLVRRGLFWYSSCWRHLLMILTIQNTERYSSGWRRTGFSSIAPASSFYFWSLSKCLPQSRSRWTLSIRSANYMTKLFLGNRRWARGNAHKEFLNFLYCRANALAWYTLLRATKNKEVGSFSNQCLSI